MKVHVFAAETARLLSRHALETRTTPEVRFLDGGNRQRTATDACVVDDRALHRSPEHRVVSNFRRPLCLGELGREDHVGGSEKKRNREISTHRGSCFRRWKLASSSGHMGPSVLSGSVRVPSVSVQHL